MIAQTGYSRRALRASSDVVTPTTWYPSRSRTFLRSTRYVGLSSMQRIKGLNVVDCFGKEDTDIHDRTDHLSGMLVKYIQQRLYKTEHRCRNFWKLRFPWSTIELRTMP